MKPSALIGILWGLIMAALLNGWAEAPATEVTPRLIPVWEKGIYRTYRLQYSDENTTTLFPDRLGNAKGGASTFMSTLSFDGDLRVKDYGIIDGNKIYSLSFDAVRSRRFALNGHDMFGNAPSFIDTYTTREIYVALDDKNEIHRFYYPQDTPQVFKTFMTTVAQEIQVAVRQGKERWEVSEVNQHGRGTVEYRVTGGTGDRIELKKTRKNYAYPGLINANDHQDIKTDDRVTLNTRGFVEEIDKHEETTIVSKESRQTVLKVKKTLKVHRKDMGRFDPGLFGDGRLSVMQAVAPGDPISDAEQNRELLAKRVGLTTYDGIEKWIRGFSPDKTDNRANNAMFYRATGFVELHPESTEKLADYCKNKSNSYRERMLVMNLLAAVGNAPAQAAMRDILSDRRMMEDPRHYGTMVQNFSFVDEKPEPETLSFLHGMMNRNEGFRSYSAAHAFGALIHNLYAGSEDEKTRALLLNRELLAKISQAKTEDDKAEYIAALGNAGMLENNERLFGYATSGTPRVRREAVMALRKTETPACRETVLRVFDDTDRDVQRSAIQTFMHYSPDAANLQKIQSKLDRELIEEANFYDLVSLLKKHQAAHPETVNACYKRMVRKKLHDPDLEARIRSLIR